MVIAAVAAVVSGCAEDAREEGPRFVQRADSRLVKVQSVGLAAFGPINPHKATPEHAVAAFGEPSGVERQGAVCRRRWRDLGLTIDFATEGDPCGPDAGIELLRVTGPAAVDADWHTAEGIRPGMSVAAALRRYPEARRAGTRRVLVEGPAGDDPQEIVTVLAVTTQAGRVDAMTFPIGE